MGYKVTDIFGYGDRNSINLLEIEDCVMDTLNGNVKKHNYEIHFEVPIKASDYMKEASDMLARENKEIAYVTKDESIIAVVGYTNKSLI